MNESTKRTLIDHQDPQRIKCFNERIAGESLKKEVSPRAEPQRVV